MNDEEIKVTMSMERYKELSSRPSDKSYRDLAGDLTEKNVDLILTHIENSLEGKQSPDIYINGALCPKTVDRFYMVLSKIRYLRSGKLE